MKKTNAMRILDKLNISYEASEYDDDSEHKLEHGAAAMTAQKLGVNPEQVFKTIVFKSDSKEVLVFCQSAVSEINLKKARTVAGVKEVTPVKEQELLGLTGYIRGGCSPVGMKKQFKTVVHESAKTLDTFIVSGGQRGTQIECNPVQLVEFIRGEFGNIIM